MVSLHIKLYNKLYLKKRNKEVFKKKFKCKFRILLPAVGAKAIAPLSPTLGQYGLSCPDFCKRFNDETINFFEGIPVRIVFTVLFNREFSFTVNLFSYTKFLCTFVNEDFKFISLLNFYKFVLLFTYFYRGGIITSLKTLSGILKTLNSNIVVYFLNEEFA